jgi:hypothetical protein
MSKHIYYVAPLLQLELLCHKKFAGSANNESPE